jgi:hypothetical protein
MKIRPDAAGRFLMIRRSGRAVTREFALLRNSLDDLKSLSQGKGLRRVRERALW